MLIEACKEKQGLSQAQSRLKEKIENGPQGRKKSGVCGGSVIIDSFFLGNCMI